MNAIAAAVVFLVSHLVLARTALRPWLVERLGERFYLLAYSALALVLLGWFLLAVLQAPRLPLWTAAGWSYGFAFGVSAFAFALLGAGIASPNPYSVTFRRAGFSPSQPGIVGWVRHPIVYGFGLWGLAHVPANGEWPPLLLFGGTVLFAVLGARSLQRRKPAPPLGAGHVDRPARLGVVAGLLLWLLFLGLHPDLFGVDPLQVLQRQLHS